MTGYIYIYILEESVNSAQNYSTLMCCMQVSVTVSDSVTVQESKEPTSKHYTRHNKRPTWKETSKARQAWHIPHPSGHVFSPNCSPLSSDGVCSARSAALPNVGAKALGSGLLCWSLGVGWCRCPFLRTARPQNFIISFHHS